MPFELMLGIRSIKHNRRRICLDAAYGQMQRNRWADSGRLYVIPTRVDSDSL
jgi:hypothetical protein